MARNHFGIGRKKKFRRRKRFRRRRFRKGPVAYRMVKALKRKIGKIEMKYQEFTAEGVPVGFAGIPGAVNIGNISTTAQGLEDNNRIGRTITIQNFLFNGRIITSSSQVNAISIRLILVAYPNSAGNNPDLTSILTDASNANIAMVSLYKKKDDDNSIKYRILVDRVMSLNNTEAVSPVKPIKIFYKFKKGLVIRYSGTVSAVSSVNKNLVKLFIFSDATSNHPALFYNWRVNFTDT